MRTIAGILTIFFLTTVTASAVTFTVDTFTEDETDTSPGDGICASAAGECTLRAAVVEANALFGADSIVLPPGTYDIRQQPGFDFHTGDFGDLHVTEDLAISSTGATIQLADSQQWIPACDIFCWQSRFFHIQNLATLTLDGLTLVGYYQPFESLGGGIYVEDGTLDFRNGTIQGCSATDGGGVYVSQSSSATIRHSTLLGNDAGSNTDVSVLGYGGAIFVDGGSLTIEDSTLASNRSASTPNAHGGGIYLASGSELTISNSTLSDNGFTSPRNRTGSSGGALYVESGASAGITNSTITRNRTDNGGGIYNLGSVVLEQTIVADNIGDTAGPDCYSTRLESLGYNLIGDTRNCTLTGDLTTNITNVDVRLRPLRDNGGPTMTHSLFGGSLAVDGGPASCIPADQRDEPRPVGLACDIGAFERGPCIDVIPGDQGNTLFAFKTNDNVELEFSAAPANQWSLYRDPTKQALGLTELSRDLAAPAHSDFGAVPMAQDFYYYLRGLSDCTGTAGP